MEKHAQATKRQIRIVNLDPAAEKFDYEPLADVRNLIQVEDAMEDEELKLGKYRVTDQPLTEIVDGFCNF